MPVINLVQIEEIRQILFRVPVIVRLLEQRDPSFISAVKEWLCQVERVLVANRLSSVADVAVLRSELISAERGASHTTTISRSKNRQRLREAVALEVLRKTEGLISGVIKAPEAQIEEGERLLRQVITVAQKRGLLRHASNAISHSDRLNTIWHSISQDPELGNAATHISGIVGPTDALALLDRVLTALE